jgi:tRNA (guanine-N7-)-methyltransferase
VAAVRSHTVTSDHLTAHRGHRPHREVVSFVRRSARMNLSQQRAYSRHRERFVLEPPRGPLSTSIAAGAPLDPVDVFGRRAPLVVEIGPGPGESLIPMASARPDVDIVCFEVFQPAVASLLSRLAAAEVGNVRVIVGDAVQGLTHLLAEGAVSEVWTFFPDPWPKARHHKRRLVNLPTADLVASRLRPDGRWRLATDWPDYANWIREVLDSHPAFRSEASPPNLRPITRFERRGLAAGRPITDLSYVRR